MNYPPMVMRLKLKQHDKRGVNLWLPLFVLAPIALVFGIVLYVILLPFVLIWMIASHRPWLWRPVLFFWPVTLNCLIALRGLEVDVNGQRERVRISFK